jgi:hypothetical protein
MTPLEAAKALAAANPFDGGWACSFCGMPDGTRSGFGRMHEPDCPWLAMPQIVVALEVAEQTVEAPMVMIEEHLAALKRVLKGETP